MVMPEYAQGGRAFPSFPAAQRSNRWKFHGLGKKRGLV
jgi:hypothetical protein